MEITKGIRRTGSGMVNVYLVEDAGEVTIVDAGAPGNWSELLDELAAMGRSLDDVRALVLTHAHVDHVGFAERLRRERRVPVRIHELDAAIARGEAKPQGQVMGSFRPLPLARFFVYGLRHGMLRPATPIIEVSTFGDGATLDVPGAPQVMLLPGHTEGSAALHVSARDTLFVGDALATLNVVTGATGPQLAPFGSDPARALQSLGRLERMEARFVLPGHGQPWTAGLPEAARLARETGLPGWRQPTGAGT
jgi:glyoxylase-like metal-dependent hydrolase (beta-lactamase superfamily II)